MWHVECKLTRKVNEKIYQVFFFFKNKDFCFVLGFLKLLLFIYSF